MFTGNRKWLIGSILILILILLISCAPASPTTSSKPTTSSQPAKSEPAGKVTLASYFGNWECKGGDFSTSLGASANRVAQLIGDSLCRLDSKGLISPALATSWEIRDGGKTMDFVLNKNAKFQNGEPVTANDVKFTIERFERDDLGYAQRYALKDKINNIEIVDDYHVIFHLNAAFPAIFQQFQWYLKIIPKAYAEKVGDTEFSKHPIAAGPFKWKDYIQDSWYEVEAVTNHYRKTPDVKTIRTVCVPEGTTRMAMLKTGEADIIDCPEEYIPDVQKDSNLRIVWSKHPKLNQVVFCDLAFPNEKLPFQDKKVRQALDYAIDRAAICDKVLHGAGDPWRGILAEYQYGFDAGMAKPTPYDPTKAKQLLAEAGYPNGFDTQFITYQSQTGWGEAVVSYLNAVGIRAKMKIVDNATWGKIQFDRTERGLIYHNTYWGNPYAGQIPLDNYTDEGTWCYYTTPDLEKACRAAAAAIDPTEAAQLNKKMNEVYLDSMVRVDLFAYNTAKGVGPRIEYFEPVAGQMESMEHEFIRLKPEYRKN